MKTLSIFLLALALDSSASAQCETNNAPIVVSPANGSTVGSPVVFEWTEPQPAVEYRVYLQGADGATRQIGTTTDQRLVQALPPGDYRWLVAAHFEGCGALRSEPATFRIGERLDCPDPSGALTSPADGAELGVGPALLRWEQVPEATGYVVTIQPRHGREVTLGFTEETRFPTFLPAGEYAWRVEPVISGCPAFQTEPNRIRVTIPAGCEDRRHPVILAPERGIATGTRVEIGWTKVPGAVEYQLIELGPGGIEGITARTTETSVVRQLAPGFHAFIVTATFEECPPTRSQPSFFRAIAPAGCDVSPTIARSYRKVMSGKPYAVHWKPIPNAVQYEVQESIDASFETVTVSSTDRFVTRYEKEVDLSQPFFYRVRGISSCGDEGAWSNTVKVVVASRTADVTSAVIDHSSPADDDEPISHVVFIPNDSGVEQTFTVSADVPWLSIEPSSGTLPVEGTTVEVTANHTGMQLGSNDASLTVTRNGSSGSGFSASNTSTTTVPLTMSLVVPVSLTSGDLPPDDALIVPGVAHAEGLGSQWQSDVRLANVNYATGSWELRYTQTATNGVANGESATVSLSAGDTLAINDLLESFYGVGALAENQLGALEIRPGSGSQTSQLAAVVTSRTYNTSPDGTFGQFIPAVRFGDFLGSDPAVDRISLQHVAESDAFRTNLGVVEAAGETVELEIAIRDELGGVLATQSLTLQPGEHRQLNGFLSSAGVSGENLRIEISRLAGEGRVTAYASVIDNLSGDPRTVSPVDLPVGEPVSRWIVPGVADLSTGTASWRTDLRIHNSGSETSNPSLIYYAQGAADTPLTEALSILPGETLALNDILASTFGVRDSGGSVRIETESPSSLVVTARTFDQTVDGTYGQFIPAVSLDDAIGANDVPLQLTQVEESPGFRTNLGLTEVSGAPVRVQVTAILPGALTAPSLTVDLAANDFLSLNSVLQSLGFSSAYNARVSVEVVEGDGKITAYASVIDNITQDPTYVSAQ